MHTTDTVKQLCYYHNGQLGIRSIVYTIPGGRFQVCLKDTDAQQFLPTSRIFEDEQAARDYARFIV